METGRVDKDELMIGAVDDAADLVSRRLRFSTRDTDAFSSQGVDECRFARVRSPNEGDKS